jgi:hypothetical protein
VLALSVVVLAPSQHLRRTFIVRSHEPSSNQAAPAHGLFLGVGLAATALGLIGYATNVFRELELQSVSAGYRPRSGWASA